MIRRCTRTRVRVALGTIAFVLGIVFAVCSKREDVSPVTIALFFLVFTAAAVDHFIALRETRS